MQATLLPTHSGIPTQADSFRREVDAFIDRLRGGQIASASRCVDGLLDLYLVMPGLAARRLIESTLSEIRFTNAVRVDWLSKMLAAIGDAALGAD